MDKLIEGQEYTAFRLTPKRCPRTDKDPEMACRGVHFALTPDEMVRLESAHEDDELMAVTEEIEDRWDRDWLQKTDKAWDAIHRCLTDGTLRYGASRLHKCILGEVSLHEGDDYFVNLLEPSEVKEVAAAIPTTSGGEFTGTRMHYRRRQPTAFCN